MKRSKIKFLSYKCVRTIFIIRIDLFWGPDQVVLPYNLSQLHVEMSLKKVIEDDFREGESQPLGTFSIPRVKLNANISGNPKFFKLSNRTIPKKTHTTDKSATKT